MICRTLFTFVLVVSFGAPNVAGAQEQEVQDAEARALFDAGQSAYDSGRYEDALSRFQQAYEMSPRAELLFNIGSAAERLRQDQLALEQYRAYLQALPDAENRSAVESRIAILQRTAEPEAAPESAVETSAPVWGWVFSGAAVVFAGLAGASWLVGDGEFTDLETSCGGGCTQEQLESENVSTWDTMTNVAIVLALASAAGAVVSFVLESGSGDSEAPALEVGIGPHGASVAGTF